jgi:hypothetical protein
LQRYRTRFGALDCGKGCLRFRNLEEVPLDVVEEMLQELWRRVKDR